MAITLAYAVSLFAKILIYALCIRAIMSWFVNDYYSPIGKIYGLLIRFTEPIVEPCRRFLSRFNTGMIDFSLILAVVLIEIARNLIIRLIVIFMVV